MKAFNEWWNKQPVSKYNPGEEFTYEEGWKAALEWAYGQTFLDIHDEIEKELDDET